MLSAPGAGLCWSVPRQDGLNVNMQEFVLRQSLCWRGFMRTGHLQRGGWRIDAAAVPLRRLNTRSNLRVGGESQLTSLRSCACLVPFLCEKVQIRIKSGSFNV